MAEGRGEIIVKDIRSVAINITLERVNCGQDFVILWLKLLVL